MFRKIFYFIIIILFSSSFSFSQKLDLKLNDKKAKNFLSPDKISRDTNEKVLGKSKVKKANIGGLFLAPSVAYAVPVGSFANYSNSTFLFGLKFELAYIRLYPFVFSFIYESQNNSGSPEFMSVNFLSQFNTQITSLGGGLDIILNKYIRSNFTTPVLSFEFKFAQVQREASPLENIPPGTILEENLITYSAGMAFTIYVFDINSKYVFAGDFSQIMFQLRIHLPIIKF